MSHTLLSVVLMASLGWISAHTNLKGKTAKKEEIHTDEIGDECDLGPGPLSLTHPSCRNLALHVDAVGASSK